MKSLKKNLGIALVAGSVFLVGCGGDSKAPAVEKNTSSESAVSGSVKIDGNNVQVGPIKVQTGENSNTVTAPGVNVKTDDAGNAQLNMQGLSVDAKADGSAKVNFGGQIIDVKTDGENSEVEIGGLKIKTEGENAEIDLGGIKIQTQDGDSIELPDEINISDED